MKRGGGLFLLLALLVSCRTPGPSEEHQAADVALFAEAVEPGDRAWTLPQSGVRITVADRPVLSAGDIAQVDVVALELGRALLLQLTPEGASVLDDRRAALGGRRLVLVVNGAAVGTMRLDSSARGGRIVLFVELGEADLIRLVDDLKSHLQPRHRRGGFH